MGRGQLKYRKRGGGSAGSGRGRGGAGRGNDSSSSAATTTARKQRGSGDGNRAAANLPSNTEKWGRAFEGGASSVGRSGGLDWEATERVLGDSDWVTGPQFSLQEDDVQLTALEQEAGGGGDSVAGLLSLDLDVLSACLMRISPHERLGLPSGFCDGLDDYIDPALQSVSDDDDDDRPKSEDPLTAANTAGDAMSTRKPLAEANQPSRKRTDQQEDGTHRMGPHVSETMTDMTEHQTAVGVADAVQVYGSTQEEDGVLDALLGLVVAEQRKASQPASLARGGNDRHGNKKNQELETTRKATNSGVGRGAAEAVDGGHHGSDKPHDVGGVGRAASGTEELEDWLDDMLADD